MNRFPIGILFALGTLVVLVLAYLATRKGGTTANIGGDVGSKIFLPFGFGASAAPSVGNTSPTIASASTSGPAVPSAISNRYGNYKTP